MLMAILLLAQAAAADAVPAGIRLEAVSSSSFTVETPRLDRHGREIHVEGTVCRRPWHLGLSPEKVQIERVGADGAIVSTQFAPLPPLPRRIDQRCGRFGVTLQMGQRVDSVEAPLVAAGMHVAAAGMRRLVDTRSVLRAAMAERGETLPQLGVSPGFKDMRWLHPVREGDIVSYSVETVSKRGTSKPRWGLVTNIFRGVNQRGQEVLIFSSAVLIARRPEKDL